MKIMILYVIVLKIMLLKRGINKMEIDETLVQKVLENSEEFKPVLKDIKNCIGLHKAMLNRSADGYIWNGPAYTQEGVTAIIEAYSRLTEDEQEKSNLTTLKQFWNDHYSSIKRNFFER